MMFGVLGAEKGEENWISKGVTGAHWKNAVKRIREHTVTSYHASSLASLKTCLRAIQLIAN